MATDVWLVKGPDGKLVPSGEADEEYLRRFKVGDVFKASVTMKRNGKHHRLGMLLLHAVFNNQDRYSSFDAFLNEVKILTGHVDTHVSASGQVYFVTRSIAFENMDELAFRRWKNEALNAVIQHFIPGMPQADQDRLMNHILAVS